MATAEPEFSDGDGEGGDEDAPWTGASFYVPDEGDEHRRMWAISFVAEYFPPKEILHMAAEVENYLRSGALPAKGGKPSLETIKGGKG